MHFLQLRRWLQRVGMTERGSHCILSCHGGAVGSVVLVFHKFCKIVQSLWVYWTELMSAMNRIQLVSGGAYCYMNGVRFCVTVKRPCAEHWSCAQCTKEPSRRRTQTSHWRNHITAFRRRHSCSRNPIGRQPETGQGEEHAEQAERWSENFEWGDSTDVIRRFDTQSNSDDETCDEVGRAESGDDTHGRRGFWETNAKCAKGHGAASRAKGTKVNERSDY